LLAKGGTGTENQDGESSQKDGTRGSLAITDSRPPVRSICAAEQPMNSRRLRSDIGLPPAVAPSVGLQHAQPAAERPASPWAKPESF
jgi:hypothetical protein